MTRREILAVAGSAPVWLSSASLSAQVKGKPRMGGTPTAFSVRAMGGGMRGGGPGQGPGRTRFDIVEHCHAIGLGGVQTNPPSADPEAIKKFRERLEAYDMHLICDINLPRDSSGVEALDAQVKAFKEAGARAFHVAITNRRYEQFSTFEPFKTMFEGIKKSVALAEPVLRKYRVPLGIENHKGYRSGEQAAWLKTLGSEWVGVCLDFGNNISLCEDPMDTCRTLAPCAVFAHIKDMAVQEYEDGFLLSEVPLGTGILDLKQIVQVLRQKDPNIIFDLEMITRDPLKIPVYTEKYWATFDDSYSPLPGKDLAKVLNLVRKNPPKAPLPRTSGLSAEAAVKLEDDLNLQCIAYARQNLDM
jgi:3-oxoisoapionate decarboxylase